MPSELTNFLSRFEPRVIGVENTGPLPAPVSRWFNERSETVNPVDSRGNARRAALKLVS